MGKARIGNVSCSAGDYHYYPTTKVYWYDISVNGYDPGIIPSTTYTSGSSTGHNVYILSESLTHSACATMQGKELCLSQPYTQYGLSGHTTGNNFTSSQQTSAKQAIYQEFLNAGIAVDMDADCSVSGYSVFCNIGGIGCMVNYTGVVHCYDGEANERCYI